MEGSLCWFLLRVLGYFRLHSASPVPQCPLCPSVPCVPCVLVSPVFWCLLCPGAPCTPVLQLLLLQVHLTWFGDNLASNMMSHFPSPLAVGTGREGASRSRQWWCPCPGWAGHGWQVSGCAGGETEAGPAGSHWPVVLQFPS